MFLLLQADGDMKKTQGKGQERINFSLCTSDLYIYIYGHVYI